MQYKKEFHKHPTIIVAIAVYNEEPYILETLRSVQSQTWTDFKVLIGDNASTDRTGEICMNFCKHDSRFIYIRHQDNMGAAANGEYLFNVSDSSYIMWLGGHDLIAPNFLESRIASHVKHPDVSLAYSRVQVINEASENLHVTCGGDYLTPRKDGLDRFIKTGLNARTTECTAVNGLFRRSAIANAPFKAVAGCDQILLAHALFYGPFDRDELALYFSRDFREPTSHEELWAAYMERIVGRRGISVNLFLQAQIHFEDFLSFELPAWKKVIYSPVVLVALDRRYRLVFWKLGYRLRSTAVRVIPKRAKVKIKQLLQMVGAGQL